MRILGVDPGTIVLGYGLIESNQDDMVLVEHGAVRCNARFDMPERLLFLYDEFSSVARKLAPDVMAVETPFFGENAKSALAIGKAQAIVLLVAAQNRIPVYEYAPRQIKQHVADYGASSKEQIQEMVKMLLDLDEVPQPSDAADALAVAICHLRESSLRDLISMSG
ncbi:MAG: crossover junction endodeoxyribonuclease RuvC [Dehalococcoidia bacterium]|nr:crossover junction endodeoxyribonuclease RuvC [Dehalococcoidia bacterium]